MTEGVNQAAERGAKRHRFNQSGTSPATAT
jgi:hypothetical protein